MALTRRPAAVALVVLTATAGGVLLTACGGPSEAERDAAAMAAATPNRIQPDGSIRLTSQDRAAVGLMIQPAREGDLPDTTLHFGRVVTPPNNEAQAVSPVTGRILHAPRVQLGQPLAAGASIVDVQPALDVADEIATGTQAAQRQGEIEAATRELAKAEADAERARTLSPQVVSAAQLQQAETVVATARARLEGLKRASTAQSTARSRPVQVTAPIAGTVVELDANVGSLVDRGDVLARIVRPGPLWVDVSVPPDEAVGDRYEVLNGAATIPARLLTRGRVTHADGTRTDRLVVDRQTASSLLTGSPVSVRVAHGTTRGVVVPDSAIVPGVDGDTVFVETAAGTFLARAVQVAARFGGQVRLASGLTSGERVVIRGSMALEGELVRAQLRPEG